MPGLHHPASPAAGLLAALRSAARRSRALERRPRPAASARPRRALAAAALLALPLLAALALAPAAQAQTTLVSNTAGTDAGGTASEAAVAFTTGSNAYGYTLSAVDVVLGASSGRDTVVTIRAGGGINPGALVATLANPSSLTNGVNTFTAPADTTLAASTTYFLVVNDGRGGSPGSNVGVSQTASNAQTGASGWSIADNGRFIFSGSWFNTGAVLRFALKGAPNGPAAPTGFTATAGPGSGQVTLRWTASDDSRITGYQYDSRVNNTGPWPGWKNFSSGGGRGATEGRISGRLTNGTLYGFRIRARAGSLGGAASDAATATPAANPPPFKPTGLTATPGEGRVALSWDNPRDSRITAYEVRTRESGGSWGAWYSVASGSTAASVTSIFVTGLTNGTAYDIQLRALAGTRAGPASDTVSATPQGTPVAQFRFASASTPEENTLGSIFFDIAPAPSAAITLAYTVTGTATRGSGGDFTLPDSDSVAVPPGGGAVLIQIGLLEDALREPDETVILTLADGAGYDLGGRTTFTLTIEDDDPPLAPAGFAAAAGDGQVVLSWTDPSDAAISGYQFRQRTPPDTGSWGTWTAIASSTAATTTHTVTGLTNGTAYGFQVRAADGTLEGAASSEATATPTAATAGVATAQPTDRQVTEGDTSDTATFTVALSTRPSNAVAVTVTAPAGLELAGPGGSTFSGSALLAFIASTWNSAQTVTVRATDDSADSPIGRELSVTYSTSSPDRSYHGLSGTAATVTVADNDPTAVTLAGSAGDVVEGGTKDFTITLNRGLVNGEALPVPLTFGGGATRGTDYTTTCPTTLPTGVACANLDSGNATVTFTGPSTGTTATTVTLTLTAAADGADESGGETVVIGLGTLNASSGTGLGGGASGADSLADFRITDAAAAPAAPTGFTAAAGPGGNQVTLSWSDPSNSAITKYQYRRKLSSSGTWGSWTDFTGGTTATSTSGTVAGLTNDAAYDFQVRALVGTVAGPPSDTATATPTAALVFSEAARLFTLTALTVVEEATGSYRVRLAGAPAGSVTVTIASDNGDVTVDTDSTAPGNQNTLTFTTTDWGTFQTVTVSAADDGDTAEDTATLTHTASGGGYDTLTGNVTVAVTVTDNDTPGLVLNPTALTVDEGDSGTYTVALATQPMGNVTVTVAGASGEVTVDTDSTANGDQNTLTFTTTTWSTAQTVTVSAGEDNDTANDSATLTHSASGGGYNLVTGNVAVTVTDNDSPGLVLNPTALTVAEGGRGTYTVKLATQPTGTVTVTVAGASGEVTFDTNTATPGNQSTLTFNASNWSTAKTVTVSADEDNDTANDSATLTHSASGGGYNSATGTVAVTVTDNDAPAAAPPAATTGLTATAEDGQVVLSWNAPTSNEITKWQYQLFEGTRWRDIPDSDATTRRHTVTGLTNGLTYNIRVRAVAGTVNGQPSAPVSVRPRFGVAVLDPTSLTVAEGGTATYRVRLSVRPRGTPNTNVIVGISSSNSDITVAPAELDFTTSNWSEPQTVTVSASQDNDDAHDRATLSHSVQGGGYTLGSGPDLNLVVNDDESATPPPTVQTNAAPTVATPIPDQNARVGAPFSHTFPAGTFNDADGDPLTYSATGLPAWLGFNPGTRTFAGTPTAVGAPAVTVTASDGNGGSASDTFAIAISAANAAPVLTIRGGSAVTEGAAASFTVTADSAPTSNLTVSRTVADAPGADFLAAGVEGSGTWTFPGGRTSQTFTIATEADSVAEPSGPIRVTLGAGTGYTLGGASTATVTVNDNDAAPATCAPTAADLISTVRGYYASNRNRADRNLGENWRRVLIAFGAERHATLTPYTAAEARASERVWSGWRPVRVELERLEACPGRQPPAPPPNTPRVTVTASTAGPVTEGGTLAFTLTARPAPAADLTVNYTVSDAANADFVAADGEGAKTAVIRAGESSADIEVATVADSADEPSGGVSVAVDSGDGYAPGDPASAEVRVADDDATTVALAGPADAIAEAGGIKAFTVTLGRTLEAHESLRVPLVFGGEATRGDDWTAVCAEAPGIYCGPLHTYVSPHVKFIGANGAPAVATVTLTAVPDSLDEGEGETVTVAIGTVETNADGGAAASGSLRFTITDDDDPLPAVTVAAGPGVTEGAAATFTLTVSPAPTAALAVNYTVADADGADFLAAGDEGTKTVTIAATATTATVTVPTVQDAAAESSGPVALRLAAGAGYQLGDPSSAMVTVSDDDATTLPKLSISDARGAEGAPMQFTITLSPASEKAVRVRMDVRNATPPSARWQDYDYARPYYDVTFAPGETEQRRWVYIYDDAHDEGEETFEVVLSRAEGAVIADAVGVGTITNDDPLPAAYLARFGRTVAEQALDGIAGRMAAPRTPGVQGTLAGRALTFAPTSGTDDAADPPGDGLGLDGPQEQLPTLSAEEALLGSRFTLTGPADATGGTTAFWGRASRSTFDGTERGDGTATTLDGTVTTALLGADYARGDWLFGLALTQSTADGTYATPGEDRSCADPEGGHCAVRAGDGDLEAQLTAAVPYAALDATPHLKLWGAAGRGAGEVTLKTQEARYRADTDWTLAAAGLRGTVLTPPPEGSGPALALTADALWTRTASDRTRDLAASRSDVTRLRLGVEGRYRFGFDGESQLTPTLEAGVRHDGGDAETGFGLELGGGLAWSAPTLGLTLDLSGRTLIAHEDDDFTDRGLSAALTFDPRPESARGPSLTLRQDVGDRAEGGLDALFAPDPLADRTESTATARWTLEGAWGFSALGGRFTASPHAGLGLSPDTRETTLGWRLTPAAPAAPDLTVGVKATRREDDLEPPAHTVGVEATVRW